MGQDLCATEHGKLRLGFCCGRGSVASQRASLVRGLTSVLRRLTGSLCSLSSPVGREMLILSGVALPGPSVSLGMAFREGRAVIERPTRPLIGLG